MSTRQETRAREARQEILNALTVARFGAPDVGSWSGQATTVADVMSWSPVVVGPELPAWTAERLADRRGVHHIPVVDRGGVAGVVCRCDLRLAKASTVVAECMSAPVFTTEETRLAVQALRLMQAVDVGCLPVVIGPRLVGIVTLGDLHRAGILPARASCRSCGGHHHIRGIFCLPCLDHVTPPPFPEHYVEIGGGD